MTLPIEIWKHCIIPYLVDDTSNCKNAVAVAGLRVCSRAHRQMLTFWKPCVYTSMPFCVTHKPLYNFFHKIVTALCDRNPSFNTNHVMFEDELQRCLFWAFVKNQLRTSRDSTQYAYILSTYKNCCIHSISKRIEVIPDIHETFRD